MLRAGMLPMAYVYPRKSIEADLHLLNVYHRVLLDQRLVGKYGKAKALSIIAQKLGRTVYFLLKKQKPFVAKQFFGDGEREPS